MKQEVRFFRSLRAEDGGQVSDPQMSLRGYAARFDTLSKDVGGFREVIKPGAFSKVLGSNPDVRMLFNHDANRILGRTSAGTLTLAEDDKGLRFCCKLDPNNSEHRNLHSSVKRGDISDCSFAFKLNETGDDDWDTAKDEEGRSYNRRTIRNFSHLFDTSIVTHPAYDGTSVGARSLAARNAVSFEEQYRQRYGREMPYPGRIALNEEALLRARLAKAACDMRRQNIIAAANTILAAEARERFLASDDPAALRERLARAEERAGGCLTAQGVGTDAVPAKKAAYCVGGSLSANADDHEKAAAEHRCLAQRCKTAKRADAHYAAADAHALAAQTDENDEDYADRCNRAVGACQRASIMEEYA
jgi:HK97 family phage prohead protease